MKRGDTKQRREQQVAAEEDPAEETGEGGPTVTVNVSEEQLAQVRQKLAQAQEVNQKMHSMVIMQKTRHFELQASIKAKQARVETHEAEETHRAAIIEEMKAQHQQSHVEQTQQTFDLSKKVMVLDERIFEVQNAITTTQDEYKAHRKHIMEQEEKIRHIQGEIQACQVQIEILKGKPGDEIPSNKFESLSLLPTDDYIPTAQNSPKWEPTGDEEEISRLGHAVDLTASVRRTRPSQLMDLASCHLDALLPKEDVDRINKVLLVDKWHGDAERLLESAVSRGRESPGGRSGSRPASRAGPTPDLLSGGFVEPAEDLGDRASGTPAYSPDRKLSG
jgi:hypothetical protein